MRAALLAAASTATLTAAPLAAQETSQTEEEARQEDSARPDASAAVPARTMETITVTAQRRAQDLQSVPIAITALSAETIDRQGLDEITDLRFTSPNVNIQKNTGLSNGAQVYIRGVGQDESSLFAEVGVGIYLDGVYLGKQNGSTIDLVEFDRVEVLRGPQGTYYGRNTNGGAIRFITRRPELEDSRGLVDVTVGSIGRRDVKGSYSAPIIDGELGFKIDGFIARQDSDFDFGEIVPTATTPSLDFDPNYSVNDIDRMGGRAALLWEPNATTSLYLTADYTRDRSGSFLPTPIFQPADGPAEEPFGRRAGDFTQEPFHEFDGGGVAAELTIDTGLGEFSSITAYRAFRQDLSLDLDGPGVVDAYQELDHQQFSQEFQLVGSAGDFDYIGGAYYFFEEADQLADNRFNQLFSTLIGQPFGLNDDLQETTSIALFGEGTWNATDAFSFTLGGRYTDDEKTAERRLIDPATGDVIWAADPEFVDENVSWRALAEYEPNDDFMLYASYATGYKAGGFAGSRPITQDNAFSTYAAEDLSTWEAGVRSDLFDRTLRLNLTYFYSVYDNFQLSVLEPATFQFGILNADATIAGVEAEFVWRPSDWFELSGNVGLNDFEYDEGDRVDPAVGVPFDQLEGKQFPSEAGRLNAVFFIPTDLGEMEVGGSATYNGAFARNVANSPNIFSESVTLLDAFAQITLPDERWRLRVEGSNITDEDYFLAGTAASADGFGGRYYTYGARWSVSARLTF